MNTIIDPSKQTLQIDVDFYDDHEKDKLLRYPSSARIMDIVSKGAKVNLAQFLTYYLFHKKRPGKKGYRNYAELSVKIDRAITDLSDWVHFHDNSLISAQDATPQDITIIERVGEAVALSVIGQIHDLHDADWDRIPESRGHSAYPTFDYKNDLVKASDGKLIVQVEAKGTALEDSRLLSTNVRVQKTKIDKKKCRIQSLENSRQYPYPADLRYGAICSLGRRGHLHCWLTDPPADSYSDPRKYRLLSRLQFIFDWISFLGTRSHFAASLATRLKALHALEDPFLLAGVPLRRGNGEPYVIPGSVLFDREFSFFARLCRVTDGPAVGTLLKLSGERLFFIGVQRSIYEMAATQDFEYVLNYREHGGSIHKSLHCVIPRGRAARMGVTHIDSRSDKRSAYVSFHAGGVLHYGHGGTVFGEVMPQEY